jgi:3-oxoadipate enol-lactonase
MTMLDVDGTDIWFEVHGDVAKSPAVVMGGWGTFAHGAISGVPLAVRARCRVLVWDYPGLGDSGFDGAHPASMRRYAEITAALCDHLGWTSVHLIGIVGMGACIAQEVAIERPDLARSLFMTGCWARTDARLHDVLGLFRDVHRALGFEAMQAMAASLSFDPAFYDANRERLLGARGAWSELRGRRPAHDRLIQACLDHDSTSRLDRIRCPTHLVHAGADAITPPSCTKPLERGIPGATGELWPDLPHAIAGRETKERFDEIIGAFLDRV